MSDCTVLVIDDAPDIRLLVKVLLDSQPGMQVIGEGANGREAVDLCAQHKPDVVVLDISMPVMDGLQALPLIREVSPETNVIMLSGFTSDEIKAEAIDLGACDVVEKGSVGSAIAAAVRESC